MDDAKHGAREQRTHCSWACSVLTIMLVACIKPVYGQVLVEVNSAVFDQGVNDMVFEAVSQHLLVTIPSTSNVFGNSVGLFDPEALTMTDAVFVGSEPGPIDVTDDGLYAYVGVNAAGAVRKLDLNTLEVISSVQMGYDIGGYAQRAVRLSCRPGSNETFAVLRGNMLGAPTYGRIDIYTDGTPLGGSVLSISDANDVRYKPQAPDRLMLVRNETLFNTLRTLSIDANGLVMIDQQMGLFSGTSGGFSVVGNMALVDQGVLFDVSDDVPVHLGSCMVDESGVGVTRACLDPYQGLVCLAYQKPGAYDTLRIKRFDMTTFQVVDQIEIQVTGIGNNSIGRILCWGDATRYALFTTNGKLIIVNGVQLPTEIVDRHQNNTGPTLIFDGQVLRSSSDIPVRFDLFDVQGRVAGSSDPLGRLEVAFLSPGMYVARFHDNAGDHGRGMKWVLSDMLHR